MKFIVLTRTNGKPVIVNLDKVVAITDCDDYCSLVFSNISDHQRVFEVHVAETMETIVKCIDESLGE